MRVLISAVQGAFIEHRKKLEALGVECIELRKKEDMLQSFDGLVLPGGESTVQGKLLRELGMFDELRECIREGMPVFATCAGLILLAERLSNDDKVYFQTLPVTVRRNAYGRQLGSFHTEQEVKGFGVLPMTFIRAPYVESAAPGVEVLARVEGKIVAARFKNQLAMAFHPELDDSDALHRAFVEQL